MFNVSLAVAVPTTGVFEPVMAVPVDETVAVA
jgi:hypothetical protein